MDFKFSVDQITEIVDRFKSEYPEHWKNVLFMKSVTPAEARAAGGAEMSSRVVKALSVLLEQLGHFDGLDPDSRSRMKSYATNLIADAARAEVVKSQGAEGNSSPG